MIKDITIIIPVYNEQGNIDKIYTAINDMFKSIKQNIKYNIVYVDDGSSDKTLKSIQNLSNINTNVKFISLSRNFGKEAAIFAGLDNSFSNLNTSHYVLMDADLQDPPQMLKKMITIINDKECECVCAKKVTRYGDPIFRSWLSNRFYSIMNRASDITLERGVRDFRLMTKKYVEAILSCGEYNRFFKGISSWIGFDVEWVEYDNVVREDGKSKWSIWKLFKYAIEAIIAYSTWPLAAISVLGIILAIIALIFLVLVIIKAIFYGDPVAGWPSLTCIILLIGSLLLSSLGVIGLYFEKLYLEVKQRPKYLLKKTNLNKED